jgi:hypothetical protein
LYPGSRYGEMKPQSVGALTTANSPLPSVLGLGIAYGLPLHVGNRIGAAAGERLNVILAVAGQAPLGLPVESQGCARWNSRVTSRDRCSFAEAAFSKRTGNAPQISAPKNVRRPISNIGSLLPAADRGGAREHPMTAAVRTR